MFSPLASSDLATSSGVVTGWVEVGILTLLFGILGYWLAVRSRQLMGSSPWRLPPMVWGVLCAVFTIWGIALELVARITTRSSGSEATGHPGAARAERRETVGDPRQVEGRKSPVPYGYGAAASTSAAGGRFARLRWAQPAGVEAEALEAAPPSPRMIVPGPDGWVPTEPLVGQRPQPPLFGWYEDPAGRHEQRYWDGRGWADLVRDDGTAGAASEPFDQADLRRLEVEV
ncbi:MAG: DUF2510 domain-containing protein [Acidimicrobiales bacterium]